MSRDGLSSAEARRLALAAQGFGRERSGTDVAGIRRLISALGAVQIDSVNVLVRSHYLPAFSRLGSYDRSLLDRAVYGKPRRVFEYWGHEASYLPLDFFPLMRWRMERARNGEGMWRIVARVRSEQPQLVARLKAAIAEQGASSPSQFSDDRRSEKWWGWTDTKRAFEFLYWCGELTPVSRRTSFERVYDLTERVIPKPIFERHVADRVAFEVLVERAALAMGVATESDLRDYFRLPVVHTRSAIAALVERGALRPVKVEDWKQQAYVHQSSRIPRQVETSALLSPFDSVVWNRQRAHRLFNFHYRIEIYTPAHKRIHGYYVLPYLMDDALVARVDVKSDRAKSQLLVHAVHYERGVQRRAVLARLKRDLDEMANWLGLERVKMPR